MQPAGSADTTAEMVERATDRAPGLAVRAPLYGQGASTRMIVSDPGNGLVGEPAQSEERVRPRGRCSTFDYTKVRAGIQGATAILIRLLARGLRVAVSLRVDCGVLLRRQAWTF